MPLRTARQKALPPRLDEIANDILMRSSEWGGHLAALSSGEMESIHAIPASAPRGKYLLLFAPLDGSFNIDVNLSVGTIFSILRSPGPEVQPGAAHFLQPGSAQVCADNALYMARRPCSC